MDAQLEDLVKTYLTIRAEREKIAREYEARDSVLKEDMSQIEAVMLSTCNEINAESIKTGSGTVIKSTKETYVCSDWTNFKDFILENQALELLSQRLHQSNFKEFINNRKEEGYYSEDGSQCISYAIPKSLERKRKD